MTIAAFADSEQKRLAPAGVLTRYQAQPRAQLPTVLELTRVAHRRQAKAIISNSGATTITAVTTKRSRYSYSVG